MKVVVFTSEEGFVLRRETVCKRDDTKIIYSLGGSKSHRVTVPLGEETIPSLHFLLLDRGDLIPLFSFRATVLVNSPNPATTNSRLFRISTPIPCNGSEGITLMVG